MKRTQTKNKSYVQVIASGRSNESDRTTGLGRQHNLLLDESVLVHKAEDVAAGDVTAHAHQLRHKVPLEGTVEGVGVDALGNVDALGHLVDVQQRTLDTIEDTAHDTGAQFDRQRLLGSQHRIADGDTS